MGDLADKLKDALNETVGASAKARDAEETFLRELEGMRSSALAKLKRSWRTEREAAAALVQRRVREYAHAVSASLKASLSEDGRMPLEINYLERYSAMKAIQDRSLLLARIDQTIELARTAVTRVGRLDPQRAVEKVAGEYRAALAEVSRIRVAPVEETEGEEPCVRTSSEDREGLLASMGEDADSAFSEEGFSLDITVVEEASREERRARFEKDVQAASTHAISLHEQRLAQNALSAAGASVELGDLEKFAGTVEVSTRFDAEEVAELADVVDASFKTFSSVVRDNGVFAAFSEGSPFGRCVGFANWTSSWDDWDAMEYRYDDSEYGGEPIGREYVRSRIPTAIEDIEEGGDSLRTSIDRMREFNACRYFGMLDDDFKQHVDAFWYGFGKLMEAVNGMFDVDMRSYLRYRDRVTDVAATRCSDLALLMGDGQVAAYCDELGRMRDAVRDGAQLEMLRNGSRQNRTRV